MWLSKKLRRLAPPVRICPGCGGQHYSWVDVLCARCRKIADGGS